MSLVINIYYTGEGNSAREFAEEMMASGIVDEIRGKKETCDTSIIIPQRIP